MASKTHALHGIDEMKIKIKYAAYLIRAAASWAGESGQARTDEATARLIADAVRTERERCVLTAGRVIEDAIGSGVDMKTLALHVGRALRLGK